MIRLRDGLWVRLNGLPYDVVEEVKSDDEDDSEAGEESD